VQHLRIRLDPDYIHFTSSAPGPHKPDRFVAISNVIYSMSSFMAGTQNIRSLHFELAGIRTNSIDFDFDEWIQTYLCPLHLLAPIARLTVTDLSEDLTTPIVADVGRLAIDASDPIFCFGAISQLINSAAAVESMHAIFPQSCIWSYEPERPLLAVLRRGFLQYGFWHGEGWEKEVLQYVDHVRQTFRIADDTVWGVTGKLLAHVDEILRMGVRLQLRQVVRRGPKVLHHSEDLTAFSGEDEGDVSMGVSCPGA